MYEFESATALSYAADAALSAYSSAADWAADADPYESKTPELIVR